MIHIRKINNYFLIALGFAFPISIAVANMLIFLITLLWLIEGEFKRKFKEIRENKLAIALYLFIFLYALSLLWSPNQKGGWGLVQLYYGLFLFPVFLTTVESKYVDKMILSFIIAMSISEIASYGIYFGFWKSYIGDPYATAFLGHVAYTPLIVFTVFLLLNRLIYSKDTKIKKYFYLFFMLTMTFNIFISGGRAGQVVFIALAFISALLYIRKNIKLLLASLFIIPVIIVVIYISNDTFQERTNKTIETLKSGSHHTALGLRINFARNTLYVIQENLLFGVGAGGFVMEYAKVNLKNSPDVQRTGQPHNQYLFVTSEIGILGLIVFLNIFYSIFKFTKNAKIDEMTNIRFLFIAFYLIIMLSDIYLWSFATQILFVYFGILLYKKFQYNPFKLNSHDFEKSIKV